MKAQTGSLRIGVLALALGIAGCGGDEASITPTASAEASYSATDVSDAIHTVVAAHRKVYTDLVVQRLGSEGIVAAHEDWRERQALLLPAQLFRQSSDESNKHSLLAQYQLKSLWPISQANGPTSDVENLGLNAVANNPGQNFYDEETVGGIRYRVSVYADTATSQSCVDCHNNHPTSPRNDFQLNEVMGGVVVRIPLN